jgi:hypothetical protein
MPFAERVPISTYEEFQPLIERTRNGEQNILGNSYKMVCKIKQQLMPKANLSR